MATYVRGAGDHVAERLRPAAGSEDEARLKALVASGAAGWRVEDVDGGGNHGPAPAPTTQPVQEPATPSGRPAQSATKADWVAWAAANGMDRETATDLTKAELIELANQLEEE